jgi:hypothetical protein
VTAVQLARATLRPQDPVPEGIDAAPVEVQFNPVQLQYEISNTLEAPGRGGRRHQIITQSSATLTVDLQFDSTHTGDSVREQTLRLKRFARPDTVDDAAELTAVPPVVRFDWGTFSFAGLIQSYRETIDFFSPDGTPLRAVVSLTMTQQQRQAEPARPPNPRPRAPAPGATPGTLRECPASGAGGASGVAQAAGDPYAAREIAQANGESSLRRSDRGALVTPDRRANARGRLGEALPQSGGRAIGTDQNAAIGPDGRVRPAGPGSMRTDVGQRGRGTGVRFDR